MSVCVTGCMSAGVEYVNVSMWVFEYVCKCVGVRVSARECVCVCLRVRKSESVSECVFVVLVYLYVSLWVGDCVNVC